jgi:hypothetical protein
MTENARGAVATAMRGMSQIHSRGYGLSMKNPIYVSIAFGKAERNVVCCLFKKDGHETCFTVEYGGENAPTLSLAEIGALPTEDVAEPGALSPDDVAEIGALLHEDTKKQ